MKLGAGKQVQTYDASGLMNGSYIMQLKTSSGLVTRKIIVKK
jgi:hypothetical protein